jgi:hypothetical protein
MDYELMALCLARRASSWLDAADQMVRYLRWTDQGY